MAASNKINKDKVLQLIKEEAYIITRKKEIFEELKKYEDELKQLNECMGLAGQGIVGTFGFEGPKDITKKANVTGFVNPMSISRIEQLAKDMGMENPYDSKENAGFGDEYTSDNSGSDESLKEENAILKQELEQLKAIIANK